MEVWYPRQVQQVQHGNPNAPKDHWMKESAAGPEQISPEELAANRVDNLANARAREMDDDWYRSQSPDWSKVTMTAGGGNSSPYRPIMVASRYPSRPLPFRHAADRNSLSRAKFV